MHLLTDTPPQVKPWRTSFGGMCTGLIDSIYSLLYTGVCITVDTSMGTPAAPAHAAILDLLMPAWGAIDSGWGMVLLLVSS
jgi:hypothetical protein